jgi:hypothetical protein
MTIFGRDAAQLEYEVELEIGDMPYLKNNIEILRNNVRRFLQNMAGLSNLMVAVTRDIDQSA